MDMKFLNKLTSPTAAEDFNNFLEKLPQNAGTTMLIMAGVTWVFAGALGLYTSVQVQKLTEFRMTLQDADAIAPIVPEIRDVPVNARQVQTFVDRMQESYSGLNIDSTGARITIGARSTASYSQFREAVGHVQNGGSGWRVNIESLCVGRECDRQPLSAALRINKVSVERP